MPARKIRIELFDSDGNRYTVAFEGQITRDKAVRLLDLVELLGGVSNDGNSASSPISALNMGSKYDRVRMIIQRSFPLVLFSSREVQTAYEQEFKEPISISTIATYLSRLTSRGILAKSGASNNFKYRLAPSFPQALLKQPIT